MKKPSVPAPVREAKKARREGSSFRSFSPITRTTRTVNTGKGDGEAFVERKVQSNSGFVFSLSTLVIVVCVFAIVLGQPLIQLANQTEQRNKAVAELQAAKLKNKQLREQLEDWNNPDFVADQARQYLGYVRPGETRYVVVGDNGKVLGSENKQLKVPNRPWYMIMSYSLVLAGDPSYSNGTGVKTGIKGIPEPNNNKSKTKNEKKK